MTILQIAEAFKTRKVSPVEFTQSCLKNIEKLNPVLNAFITVLAESALNEAKRAEFEIGRGDWRGPLHGIPIALKDNIDTAGIRTTAASNLFKDRIPTEDADVVRRLKNSGAVLIGKTNLHEFAFGGSSLISAFGPVRNPRNPEYITGGSSGGSAAAVAAEMCVVALGTDTGGSIRQPSACCGVVGLKPTYGRVSNRGVIPLSISLDHTGPITSCVSDAAVVLQAIHDADDPASSDVRVGDFLAACDMSVSHLRVGLPEPFFADLDPQVETKVQAAVNLIRPLVGSVQPVNLTPDTDTTVLRAEAFRYHSAWMEEHPELYQSETLRRLRTGAEVTDAELGKHREELKKTRQGIAGIFKEKEVDVLIVPTISLLPPRINDLVRAPDLLRSAELALLRNTRSFNAWGIPAMSVPCGVTAEGLPVGLQIAAAPWREDLVLALASACERQSA